MDSLLLARSMENQQIRMRETIFSLPPRAVGNSLEIRALLSNPARGTLRPTGLHSCWWFPGGASKELLVMATQEQFQQLLNHLKHNDDQMNLLTKQFTQPQSDMVTMRAQPVQLRTCCRPACSIHGNLLPLQDQATEPWWIQKVSTSRTCLIPT